MSLNNNRKTAEQDQPDYDGLKSVPVFAICGYSGSGKTTLIEELIPIMNRRGLRVVVIKHDCHGLSIDREGKDSDRFFKAGADVVAEGPGQACHRLHVDSSIDLHGLLGKTVRQYDIIFVEGHKSTPLPNKIWLQKDNDEVPPPEASDVRLALDRNVDRTAVVTKAIDEWADAEEHLPPVYAGILIGGNSSRMGRPKHLMANGGSTWLETVSGVVSPLVDKTVILGQGQVPSSLQRLPVLPDIPRRSGPIAGMLSAMRWQPRAGWIFLACDIPMISTEAIEWILEQREAGVWAILPSLEDGRVEPLFAYYDFRSLDLLEKADRPSDIAASSKVITPTPPERFRTAWTNVNKPEDVPGLPARD